MEAAANIRSELHAILDRLLDEMNQAALAMWFGQMDRPTLKSALENEETALEWGRRMIRGGEEIIPRLSLNPGQAHRTAIEGFLRPLFRLRHRAFLSQHSASRGCLRP